MLEQEKKQIKEKKKKERKPLLYIRKK